MWVPYRVNDGLSSAWTRVVIRPPSARQHDDELFSEALVDTGAQMVHIPDTLAYRLDLPLLRKMPLLGLTGGVVEASVYLLSVEGLDSGSYHEAIEVAATYRNKLVLGMNYLKHFTTTFEGKAHRFELRQI